MTRLVLVRHGQSEWNAEQRVQGQSGTGLSETGRLQAEAVADWLGEVFGEATVVASDLQRCRETAAPIARRLGVDVRWDEALRERSFGSWEGRTLAELQAQDADRWLRWRQGEDVVSEVGGESGESLARRSAAAFRSLADPEDRRTVVLVTHGGTIWHGVHELLGLGRGTLGGVGNTAVTQMVLDGPSWWLDTWNQMAHVPVALQTTFRPAEMKR